jgi:integrase
MTVTLTDKRVRGLRTDGKRLEIRDSNVRNLVLRVTPGGCKSWSVQHRVKGRAGTQRITLGSYPAVGIADARGRARDVIRKLAEGRDPIFEKQSQALLEVRQALTFAGLLDDYLERRRGVISMREVERELRKDALPVLGAKRPAEITAADIDAVAQAILARGSPLMARRIIVSIKAIFNHVLFEAPGLAQRYGIIDNPAALLGRRRRGSSNALAASKPRQRLLSDAEIRDWWVALDASKVMPARAVALRLVLTTGQRPGEVRQCRPTRLRLDGAEPTWTLLEEDTKNGRRHHVPLSRLAVELFSAAVALGAGGEFIFADPERPGEPIGKAVLPTAQRGLFHKHLPQLEPATVHDLRRTAATGMRRIGVAPHVVSQVLNHARPDVTGKHYDFHEGLPERRAALELWAGHIQALVASREVVVPLRRPA